eukprot:SAG31_NODE_1319_length_8817_cov_1.857077_5_plen_174_part_00
MPLQDLSVADRLIAQAEVALARLQCEYDGTDRRPLDLCALPCRPNAGAAKFFNGAEDAHLWVERTASEKRRRWQARKAELDTRLAKCLPLPRRQQLRLVDNAADAAIAIRETGAFRMPPGLVDLAVVHRIDKFLMQHARRLPHYTVRKPQRRHHVLLCAFAQVSADNSSKSLS